MKSPLIFLLFCGLSVSAQRIDYPIQPVLFTNVHLTDAFWSKRIELNRTVTIPASFSRCENTGRMDNFRMAAARKGKFCTKFPFDDTDIYKTIEGASYSLAVHPDAKLGRYIDSLISIIARAQEKDGYLYTARTIDPLHPHSWAGTVRWQKENELSHELYNSGHLFEAAGAHFQATGKKNLLGIALKNADLLVETFGPGKLHVAPGHEIVEMGLVRLYRITSNEKYLALARFFIDQRGKRTYDTHSADEWKNGKYWQDDQPVTAQNEAEGHAVRAMYLYSGMADIAALTGDQQYTRAIDSIWENMVSKKIYVQGGIGAVPDGERFGNNYELPNATAYNETCAAIGNVYWNQRMFLLHGDSKYIDLLEKVLYNGLISGLGLDGKSFFYTNAMEVSAGNNLAGVEKSRSGWFECSCCPTNMIRFLPSLPGYIYAVREDALYINLFIPSAATVSVQDQKIGIVQENTYPWAGDLNFRLTMDRPAAFSLKIRIPGWSQNKAIPEGLYAFQGTSEEACTLTVNGSPATYTIENGYAVLHKQWTRGDQIRFTIPMPVRMVVAAASLKEDSSKVALQRGPLIYCAEWKDNNSGLKGLSIPEGTPFETRFNPDLLNGVMEIRGKARLLSTTQSVATSVQLVAIPYYAWANRGAGEMKIWFPETQTHHKSLTF